MQQKCESERNISFLSCDCSRYKGRLAKEQVYSIKISSEEDDLINAINPLSELRTHTYNFEPEMSYREEAASKMIGKQDLLEANKNIILDFLEKPTHCGMTLIAGAMGSGKTLFARNLCTTIKQASEILKVESSPLILSSFNDVQHQDTKLNGWRKILKVLLDRLSYEYHLSHEDTLNKLLMQKQVLLSKSDIIKDILDLNGTLSNSQVIQSNREDLATLKKKESTSFDKSAVIEIGYEIIKCYVDKTDMYGGLDTKLISQYKGDSNHIRPPLVIFLDDLQDHDELSWSLLSKVAANLKRVYIVGMIRVDEYEFLPSDKAQFVQQSIIDLTNKQTNIVKLIIEPLTCKEVAQLTASTLGATDCALSTAEFYISEN